MKHKFATFLVAHGDLARSLIRTVENILGPQKNVFTFSNQTDTLSDLVKKMTETYVKNDAENTVCFTDLKGGSCWSLANMVRKKHRDMIIVSGVNLPMLVTYFNNKDSLRLDELLHKVTEDACRGITMINKQ